MLFSVANPAVRYNYHLCQKGECRGFKTILLLPSPGSYTSAANAKTIQEEDGGDRFIQRPVFHIEQEGKVLFIEPHCPRTRAHTHTNTRARARARTYARTHAHTYARTHAHTYVRMHARTHARTHTHTHTHTHTLTHSLARTHAYTHTHTHTPSPLSK